MGKKILVIEDSKTSRRELVRLVQDKGYTVLEAENGRLGLEVIKSHSDICLVFCDLNMPEMNGVEFLSALRQESSYRSTPVIMMSRDVTDLARAETAKFKVAAWIRKPSGFAEVGSLLDSHCS